MLKVEKIVNGFLKENCYVIYNEKDALLVDPGSEENKIAEFINSNGLIIKGILITHYHYDHIGCLEYFKNAFPNAKIVDSKNSGDIVIDSFKFKVIETFGHTMDSCSFHFETDGLLFTGDFVFRDTIGNYEIDNEEYMFKSLQVMKYIGKNNKVFPGHGEITTVDYELKNSPFLKDI